ncbi:MAG: signal peptidase I, partial [Bacilli bacterium]|nr:signal peptidase I [Bacilli bacterium]
MIKGIKGVASQISKIISYICLAVLFLVACFLLFYIFNNQIARMKNEPALMNIFTIVSPSMEPNIKVYDVIVEFKVNNESDLKVGDIITFYTDEIDTGGYTVTHRINSIDVVNGKRRYVTKGDNNQNVDNGFITYGNIVGKVKYIIPGAGRIQFFISSRLGWLLIILIPAMGNIISDFFKLMIFF